MKCFPWVSSIPATSSAAACLMGALSSISSLYSSRACAQQWENSWPHSYHMQRRTVPTAASHIEAYEVVSAEVPYKPHAHMPQETSRDQRSLIGQIHAVSVPSLEQRSHCHGSFQCKLGSWVRLSCHLSLYFNYKISKHVSAQLTDKRTIW